MSGFKATRTITGGQPVLRHFPVTLGAGLTYAKGDLVRLASGKAIPATAQSSTSFLGVVEAVGKVDANGEFKPLTFNQPDRGPYLQANETGVALVNIAVGQLYIGTVDVSASAGLIGQGVGVSAGTANTAAGISGMSLKGSTLGAVTTQPFKVVGIAATDLLNGRGDKASGSALEIKPNSTLFVFE